MIYLPCHTDEENVETLPTELHWWQWLAASGKDRGNRPGRPPQGSSYLRTSQFWRLLMKTVTSGNQTKMDSKNGKRLHRIFRESLTHTGKHSF